MKFRLKLPFLILFDMAFGRKLIEFLVECLVEEHLSLHKFPIFLILSKIFRLESLSVQNQIIKYLTFHRSKIYFYASIYINKRDINIKHYFPPK